MAITDKPDGKMQLIGDAIALQADQKRKAIIEEAGRIREEQISLYKDEVIEEMFHQLQLQARAVRQKTVRDKALIEQKAYRHLLTRRGELTASVFQSAKAKLLDYAASDLYREALLTEVAALADRYDHAHSQVALRPEDLPLAGRIQALLPGCTVEPSKQIRLGGFTLRNRAAGVLVDQTLDQRLEEQRSWFLGHCGLKTV